MKLGIGIGIGVVLAVVGYFGWRHFERMRAAARMRNTLANPGRRIDPARVPVDLTASLSRSPRLNAIQPPLQPPPAALIPGRMARVQADLAPRPPPPFLELMP